MRAPRLQPSATSDLPGCLGLIIYSILFVAGGTILYSFFYEDFAEVVAARRWISTPAVIEKSFHERTPQTNIYRPRIRYTYTFSGKNYDSLRIYAVRKGADTLPEVEALIGRFPAGASAVAYVNPANPSEAVLDRSFKPFQLIGLIPLLLLIIGAIGLVGRAKRWALPSRPGDSPYDIAPSAAPSHEPLPVGPVTYTAPRGFLPLVFCIIFCIVWNSIISFLVREVLSHWRAGVPSCYGMFLTLFALPFVAVGLVLIVMPFYFFLRLFNPRPTITLSSAAVPLGGSIDISWHFTGRTDRMRRICVFAEGREEATYTRGTTTSTDRETFALIRLIDTDNSAQFSRGRATLRVPVDTMHSFDAPRNKIVWLVKIHGQIPRWPDVDADFTINVLPLPAVATQSVESPVQEAA